MEITIRMDSKNGEIVGFTILNFTKRLKMIREIKTHFAVAG